MSCPVSISNKSVMNKYVWMGRQLRNFNDVGSIINWANAMILVKGLILEEQRASPPYGNSPPSPFSYAPSQHHLSGSSTDISDKTLLSNHSTRSISPPIAVYFESDTKRP